MVGAYIDRGVRGVGKVRPFEVGVTEQSPFEIAQTKIRFFKTSIAKINLFGSALPHHQPFQIQTEKIAVIEDTFPKTQGVGIKQTLPIRHRPIDPDHLARDKLDIAHFSASKLHQAQIAVFKTTFGKFTGGKKGLAKIAGDERAVIKFGFDDLFAVEINVFEFFGEYVHGIGDRGHGGTLIKLLLVCSQGNSILSFKIQF